MLMHLRGKKYFPGGYLAVDFFFILSGFVLTHAYENRIMDGVVSMRKFVIDRIARLWPLHIFIILIIFIVSFGFWLADIEFYKATLIYQVQKKGLLGPSLFNDLFLLTNIFIIPGIKWGYNGVSWSISVELWVNFIFLYILLKIQRKLILSGCLVLFCYLSLFHEYQHLHLVKEKIYLLLNTGWLRGVGGILLGLICYHIHQIVRVDIESRQREYLLFSFFECLIIAWVMRIMLYQGRAIGDFEIIPCGAILILVFSKKAGLFSMLLRCRALVLLGTLSYSIYLTHQFIKQIYLGFGFDLTNIFNDAIYILTVFLFSYFCYRFVEMPGKRYFKRLKV